MSFPDTNLDLRQLANAANIAVILPRFLSGKSVFLETWPHGLTRFLAEFPALSQKLAEFSVQMTRQNDSN